MVLERQSPIFHKSLGWVFHFIVGALSAWNFRNPRETCRDGVRMKIKHKNNEEILHAVYMTWTESEFPKDGEKFMLLVGAPMPQRPAQPYVIVPTRPDLVIRPEDSSSFRLISTTETGRVNLEADGFQFAPEE